MTDDTTPQPEQIDYGDFHSIMVEPDGAQGWDVTRIRNRANEDVLPGKPGKHELPDMNAYIRHMRQNGYMPTNEPPASSPVSNPQLVHFRRIPPKPAPTFAEIAMGLVPNFGAGATPKDAATSAPAPKPTTPAPLAGAKPSSKADDAAAAEKKLQDAQKRASYMNRMRIRGER